MVCWKKRSNGRRQEEKQPLRSARACGTDPSGVKRKRESGKISAVTKPVRRVNMRDIERERDKRDHREREIKRERSRERERERERDDQICHTVSPLGTTPVPSPPHTLQCPSRSLPTNRMLPSASSARTQPDAQSRAWTFNLQRELGGGR